MSVAERIFFEEMPGVDVLLRPDVSYYPKCARLTGKLRAYFCPYPSKQKLHLCANDDLPVFALLVDAPAC